MIETYFLSKVLLDEEELRQNIRSFAEKYKYRINEGKTYVRHGIDLYRDISDEVYLVGFSIVEEEDFFADEFEIKGGKYHVAFVIDHHSQMLSEVNVLIPDILEIYPDLLVVAEDWEQFHSKADIESGNVAAWLKE